MYVSEIIVLILTQKDIMFVKILFLKREENTKQDQIISKHPKSHKFVFQTVNGISSQMSLKNLNAFTHKCVFRLVL